MTAVKCELCLQTWVPLAPAIQSVPLIGQHGAIFPPPPPSLPHTSNWSLRPDGCILLCIFALFAFFYSQCEQIHISKTHIWWCHLLAEKLQPPAEPGPPLEQGRALHRELSISLCPRPSTPTPPPLPVARRTPLLRRDQVLHFPALGLRSNFSLRRTALPSTPTSWNLLYATQMPPPSQGPASPPSWTELSFLSFLASLAKDLSLANTLCFRAGEPSDLTPKWFFTLSAFLARTPNVWPLSGTQLISTFSTRSSWCLWSIENSPRVSATCTLRCFH